MIIIMKSVWITLVGLLMLSVCVLSYTSTALAVESLDSNVDSAHIIEKFLLKKRRVGSYMNKLPRNSAPVRKRNRCSITGRVQSEYRRFGPGIAERLNVASDGALPDVSKSSW